MTSSSGLLLAGLAGPGRFLRVDPGERNGIDILVILSGVNFADEFSLGWSGGPTRFEKRKLG
jgi:hypothetical protein